VSFSQFTGNISPEAEQKINGETVYINQL
jgi:hypothetical protein